VVFDQTYSGDNQIGMGTTPLSDNLQLQQEEMHREKHI
jgi:hypothetical protein